ncbi:ABC-F family ATP-binding cassette domain-containing protein [bacterium]|nr:ABC-F family ATP-binding cassette domain-containing protein [bacterium]
MAQNVLISTQSIHKAYGNTVLFKDLSLNVHNGERIGLIGPNGTGKSTLLKILSGMEQVDQGKVSANTRTSVAYLSQIDNFPDGATIRQIIKAEFPNHLEKWEIQKRLNEIQDQVQFSDLDLSVQSLSGGWKKRVALAAILARDSDLVLLDEPTNHNDLEGILWLESLLKSANFAFILISHDRLFLENICNAIIDLDHRYKQGYLKVRGNYSQFIQDREKYLSDQRSEELTLSNKVRRETEWLRRGPKARTTKAQYRIDKAYTMIDDLSELKHRNNLASEAGINFEAGDRRSKKLLFTRNLSKSRGGKLLFKDLELFLSPGMKIGIMGANGSGKSSLINILRGELAADSGEIELAQGIHMMTLDQTRELPDADQSLRRALAPDGDIVIYQGNPLHISTWAKKFLFQKEQLDLPVAQLSGGERARVLLAKLMLETAEILILDEPTNDLDIPTLEVLEESLIDYSGALLLITHDRFLMDRVCDQIMYLSGDGTVKVFADTFQLIEYQRSGYKQEKPEELNVPRDNKMRHQTLKSLRNTSAKVERDIGKAEARKIELDKKLHDPANATNPEILTECSLSIEALNTEIDKLFERWASLDQEIAELNS